MAGRASCGWTSLSAIRMVAPSSATSDRPTGLEMSNGTSKLPVWQTVVDAYRFTFGNLAALECVAATPAAIFAAVLLLYGLATGTGSAVIDTTALIIDVILSLLFFPFVAKWHRVTLFGPQHEKPRIVLELGGRELSFALYYILISLVAGLAPLLAFGIVYGALPKSGGAFELFLHVSSIIPVFVAGLLASGYVFARLSLALPAIAAGLETSLRMAWRQASGNSFRIVIILLVAEFPWVVCAGGATFIDFEGQEVLGAIAYIASTVAFFMFAAILATCLSLAYLRLVGLPGSEVVPDERTD